MIFSKIHVVELLCMEFKIHLTIWLMGFISGLSLTLTGATLNFWLAQSKISTAEIGLFALVAMPYCINFIWSPILDTYKLPILNRFFGQQLSWILLLQTILGVLVFLLSFFDPATSTLKIAILALIIAFISSTNDNLLSALRSQIISAKHHGQSAGSYVFGYRIGMLVCSSGAMYLSIFISWRQIYQMIGCGFWLLGFCLLFLMADKQKLELAKSNKMPQNPVNISNILKSIGSPNFIFKILVFLILYRIADNFISTMINPFLLDLEFSVAQIATTGKLCSSIGTIIGGILGGYIMKKINIIDSLLYFGILHTSAHLLLTLLAMIGNNISLYFLTSVSESVTGGMAMAAYIGFISAMCKGSYKTTQQALLNSMMGISRSILPSISGLIAIGCEWFNFFLITFFLSIPALIMIKLMSSNLKKYINEST